MQYPQAKLKEITRLLASWPSAAGEGDEQLRSYLLAVEDYPAQDVEAAVTTLIKGIAPGVNPNFLPPPAALGSESHRQNHLRCDREDRDRRLRPALAPPDIEHTPESRARMKVILDAGVARLQAVTLPENEADAKRAKEQWDRVNARFYPDMTPGAVRRRLWTAGDDRQARDD